MDTKRSTPACHTDNVHSVERRPELYMTRSRWHALLRELARRGGGTRESGAFLLARLSRPRDVVEIAYYDDLDPDCLTGGISFSGTGYSQLWSLCRGRGLTVVADVHTHPGTGVRQSGVDAANPMIGCLGHVAIIVPDLGRSLAPELAGVHVYAGGHKWTSYLGKNNQLILHIDGPGRSAGRLTAMLIHQAFSAARTVLRSHGSSRRTR